VLYLGIDFLVTPNLRPHAVEVNLGLPGGAQEYDLTCLVHNGGRSDVFWRIEEISRQVYGKPFREYLYSQSWLTSLKSLKLWLDGQGPFPKSFHPALRLEDKWVQYQFLSPRVPMPETRVFDPENQEEAEHFLAEKGRLVGKRRLGRGGHGFRLIDRPEDLAEEPSRDYGCLLQEWVDSRAGSYVFSIRSIAFGGRHICSYANLASRPFSNHGILAYVDSGDRLRLSSDEFKTRAFNQKSWEAEIWFGEDEPAYLRHNLYEDEVAATALVLPGDVIAEIKDISIRIERFYESLDLAALPRALFEQRGFQ
jgi:hypothetical protein